MANSGRAPKRSQVLTDGIWEQTKHMCATLCERYPDSNGVPPTSESRKDFIDSIRRGPTLIDRSRIVIVGLLKEALDLAGDAAIDPEFANWFSQTTEIGRASGRERGE